MKKIYELTTNGVDGYSKYYVIGIKNDEEAKRVALKAFGRRYYWDSGISFYDVLPIRGSWKGQHGSDWKGVPTISEFIKRMRKIYKR